MCICCMLTICLTQTKQEKEHVLWQYASFLGSFWVQFTAGPCAGRRATGSLRRKHCDAVTRDRGILLIRHTVHI